MRPYFYLGHVYATFCHQHHHHLIEDSLHTLNRHLREADVKMLIRNSLVLLFLSTISSVRVRSQSLLTQECLEIASDRDCTVFNKCCDFKCRQSVKGGNKEHFCMALFGRIQRSECVCNAASSLNAKSSPFGLKHLDIVTGVFLLFAFDFVLLTFAL